MKDAKQFAVVIGMMILFFLALAAGNARTDEYNPTYNTYIDSLDCDWEKWTIVDEDSKGTNHQPHRWVYSEVWPYSYAYNHSSATYSHVQMRICYLCLKHEIRKGNCNNFTIRRDMTMNYYDSLRYQLYINSRRVKYN